MKAVNFMVEPKGLRPQRSDELTVLCSVDDVFIVVTKEWSKPKVSIKKGRVSSGRQFDQRPCVHHLSSNHPTTKSGLQLRLPKLRFCP